MIERRFHSAKVQLRSSTNPESIATLTGYAALFSYPGNQHLSEDLRGFRERIDRQAFERSLRNGDEVHATINHDASLLIGKTSNKTLRLSTDYNGLFMSVDLPNTSYARDLVNLVTAGYMSQQSFAFTVDDDQWSDEPDPENQDHSIRIRTLKSVRLADTSVVSAPAYLDTSVKISSIQTQPVDTVWSGPTPRGLNDYFPHGIPNSIPLEMRSKILTADQKFSKLRQSRKNLMHLMLS